MTLPPLPWTARGSRIYAADGEEIVVATKASPKHRASAEATAAAIVERMNLPTLIVDSSGSPVETLAPPNLPAIIDAVKRMKPPR